MILNSSPENEAIMSNVSEIGEFRIRNSAKAFSILSSGLYANKVRAIIRELSCNAYDSHVAAGKKDTPFDVHLPSTLDPTFRIRDYGTGLTNDQVVSIYTTYFESTKTTSNEFVGALGLGSKSPFSYTDNFTVTAIKDGMRNVYSAFINNEGVPSIALMLSEDSDQPNGVEVQFAVNARDFSRFQYEAESVYSDFANRPIVTGGIGQFDVHERMYHDKDIIDGVHYLKNSQSIAVMGNISYPIDIPESDSTISDDLLNILACGLEIHFNIGELDFQASREGLSYVPQTLNAIKNKVDAVSKKLVSIITEQANNISNEWERTYFLLKKICQPLWEFPARQYILNSKFDLISGHGYSSQQTTIRISKRFFEKCNVKVDSFTKMPYQSMCRDVKPYTKKEYIKGNTSFDSTRVKVTEEWTFDVSEGTVVVINDTDKGIVTRTKYHFRNANKNDKFPPTNYTYNVFTFSPLVKGKPMNLSAVFKKLRDIPETQRANASELLEKERKDSSATKFESVSILALKTVMERGVHQTRWVNCGQLSDFDTSRTYFYIPVSGYEPVSGISAKSLAYDLEHCGIAALSGIVVHAVRKGDIDKVKTHKNWVELEEFLKKSLKSMRPDYLASIAIAGVDCAHIFLYNKSIADGIIDSNSSYLQWINKLQAKKPDNFKMTSLRTLVRTYAKDIDIDGLMSAANTELLSVKEKYPLLDHVRSGSYFSNSLIEAVTSYINLIDAQKGN